jgi:hypothetical protein
MGHDVTPEAVLSRLEQLVDDERSAIIALDADRILTIAEEKQAILDSLNGALPRDTSIIDRFAALVPKLRQNGVLLAHARDCLRDAIQALHGEVRSGPSSAGPKLRPGARLSVTG